jgi:group I intron endonuclease
VYNLLGNSFSGVRMTVGIYAIICDKTWRSYVGQSVNLDIRFQEHLRLLRSGIHNNVDLQKDFNIYGESQFYYETLELVSDDRKLGAREAYWINFSANSYNKTNPSRKIELSKDEQERFWKWVRIGEIDECWDWFGAADKDGYGRIGFRRDGIKRMFRANRVSYYINNPNDDINLIIRHKCNNPKCCNPKHLCIGSNSENARDKLTNKKHQYKLNWSIVRDVRNKFLENTNIRPDELNLWFKNKYNLETPRGYLIAVCQNKNWIDNEYHPPTRTLKYYLQPSDIELIKHYLKLELNRMQIMHKLNIEHNIPISETNIHRVITRLKGE